MKIDVSILGATVYTGAELIRLLDAHPHFRIVHLAAHSQAGKPAGVWFKAGAMSAAILTEIDGIRPCPYLARAHWVAMEGLKPLAAKELRAYLSRAHGLVAAGLSKRKREALGIAYAPSADDFNPFA